MLILQCPKKRRLERIVRVEGFRRVPCFSPLLASQKNTRKWDTNRPGIYSRQNMSLTACGAMAARLHVPGDGVSTIGRGAVS